MKKILEVVGRMDRAGQETFLMNLLRSYDSSKYEITFAVNTFHKGEYEEEIMVLGGKIWHNKYAPTIKNLKKYLYEFKHFLLTEGPFDVIHCHVYFFSGFILKIAHEVGIPIRIMHSHNTSDGFQSTLLRRIYRKYALNLIKKHSTEYVACGMDAYRGLFKEDCPSDKQILNNGIVPTYFNLSYKDKISTRSQLGISPNSSVLINVARFSPVKNHIRIIDIFEGVLKINPNTILILVGDGELRHSIEELAKQKGIYHSIRFLGIRNDIPSLLNASDALIMPSLFEGLPVSLIEAQAAGTFCVVSSSITTEVDMGLNLIQFINLEDSNSVWAKSIIERMSNIRPRFEDRIRQIEKRGYTISATWNKLNEFYGG